MKGGTLLGGCCTPPHFATECQYSVHYLGSFFKYWEPLFRFGLLSSVGRPVAPDAVNTSGCMCMATGPATSPFQAHPQR